jgi:hypothetical protein
VVGNEVLRVALRCQEHGQKVRRTSFWTVRALIVVPRDINHTWLAAMSEDPWSCCIPRDVASPIVGHIGGRARGFVLVFSQCGVVLEVMGGLVGGAADAE